MPLKSRQAHCIQAFGAPSSFERHRRLQPRCTAVQPRHRSSRSGLPQTVREAHLLKRSGGPRTLRQCLRRRDGTGWSTCGTPPPPSRQTRRRGAARRAGGRERPGIPPQAKSKEPSAAFLIVHRGWKHVSSTEGLVGTSSRPASIPQREAVACCLAHRNAEGLPSSGVVRAAGRTQFSIMSMYPELVNVIQTVLPSGMSSSDCTHAKTTDFEKLQHMTTICTLALIAVDGAVCSETVRMTAADGHSTGRIVGMSPKLNELNERKRIATGCSSRFGTDRSGTLISSAP